MNEGGDNEACLISLCFVTLFQEVDYCYDVFI